MWSDKSALIRSGIVSAGLVLSLAACSALMPGQNPGGGGPAGPSQPVAGDGPGVTDDSVKVVFVGTDLTSVEALTGFVTEDPGSLEDQVQALEDWVNANGGLGGRKLDAVYKLYDGINDSQAAEEQLCNQITQDEKAFAAVLTGQFQTNARPCYAQRKTIALDATLLASDQEYYEELAPFLWSPSYPELGDHTRSVLKVLEEEGFFDADGGGVGVVAADSPVNERVYKNTVVPYLEERGVDFKVSWIDTTDMGTLNTTLSEAAGAFRNAGLKNVMFLGGARMASMFSSQAGALKYEARYAMTSYDNPTYFTNNGLSLSSPEMRNSMVGVGTTPAQEVTSTDSLPFPSEQEEKCFTIYKDAGIEWETREGARVALPYCDAVMMLKLGADNVPEGEDFNAWTWSDALKANAADYSPAAGFGNGLVDADGNWKGYAGSGGFKVMRFDPTTKNQRGDQGQFLYEGEERSFDDE